MDKKDEAVSLLKKGYSPNRIALKININIDLVHEYLLLKVGEGAIKKSDILLSIDKDSRNIIEGAITKYGSKDFQDWELYKLIPSIDFHDIKTYLLVRDAKTLRGDMYEYISDIEMRLHQAIKKVLIDEFGPDESGWWRRGIPPTIRSQCAKFYEEDSEPAKEAYCYTNFIHLKDIIDNLWNIFVEVLPKKIKNNKKIFFSGLIKLNHIRNGVMHPIKGYKITEDDFIFVREFYESIIFERWQNPDV